MVARMMRWRPWPPLSSKKFEVSLVVRRVEGLPAAEEEGAQAARMAAEVRWKGPKAALRSLRRSVRRNRTREEEVRGGGVVEWEEEFRSVCGLAAHRESPFQPWVIAFAVLNVWNQGPKNKSSVLGMASLNLAEFVSAAEEKEIEITIPLLIPGVATEFHPSLHLALSLLELRTSQESSETMQGSMVPVSSSSPSGDALPSEKDDLSALKAGLRKVKLFREFVSTRRAKKAGQEDVGSEGRCSDRSDDAEYIYPFDSDSVDDDLDEGELEDGKGGSFRNSFSYGTLASANYLGGSFYPNLVMDEEYEDWVYYSHQRSDVGCSHVDETRSSVPEQSPLQTSKRSILPWRKRKLSFRSPKSKGEPLLKKAYGEDGGDDIDFDRRQLSSSDESLPIRGDGDLAANQTVVSQFGDDNFAVGNWECKELVSRDGHMKLCTKVFFASIDQRSERAAGESACTALVAVIADWFQANLDMMPIKSQFDTLIREGSLEWRNLCENQAYRERFPDKHFDLETVLDAKIRPLSVVPGKSFIGFFHPKGTDESSSGLEFLHGAMSFDSIWDEISQACSDCPSDVSPRLYVVSWNDHFFVLKVEPDAYYIIDTLGERLHEGCDQAYILKFDESTSIHRIPSGDGPATGDGDNKEEGSTVSPLEGGNSAATEEQQHLVCRGKESCKEYIKSFLAAIPIRELQVDIKKGLMASTLLHHRLQIEFHYTTSTEETRAEESDAENSSPAKPEELAAACTSTPAMNSEVEVV